MQQDIVLDRHKPPGRKTDYCFQVVGLLTFHFIQKHHYPLSNIKSVLRQFQNFPQNFQANFVEDGILKCNLCLRKV